MKKHIQESIQEAVQKAWTEAVSALQGMQDEVGRRVRQAVDKAELRQGTEEAQRLLADFGKRLQQNSEAAGQKIEESVRSVYSRIRAPLLDEIGRLRSRAEELGQRIDRRVRRKGAGGEGPGSQT
jgi:polyhydroxyalkanoate synthesis regulator phasin